MAARKTLERKVVFPFSAVSSISERVFSVAGNSVTSNRASLNPEKVDNKVLNCGWVGVKTQESLTLGEFSNVHVYIAFWIILGIILLLYLFNNEW